MNNKDLIAQYVDTGLMIPEYQINKLPKNVLETYLRKRLIGLSMTDTIDIRNINSAEYRFFNNKIKKKVIDGILAKYNEFSKKYLADFNDYGMGEYGLPTEFLNVTPDDLKSYYITNGGPLDKHGFKNLNDDLKQEFLKKAIDDEKIYYGFFKFNELNDDLKKYYMDKGNRLSED